MRTRQCAPINMDTVVIGVDVAKERHTAVAVLSGNRHSKALTFDVGLRGFEMLEAFAERIVREWGAKDYLVALEPTGHYGQTLVEWLSCRRENARILSVRPELTSRGKVLFDGTTRKTDAKDAAVVGEMCRMGFYKEYRLHDGPYGELRILARQREQLVKERGQVLNRLHQHLDQVFPEFFDVFKLDSKTGFWIAANVPTPAAVLAMPEQKLEDSIRQASRGQVKASRVKLLRQAADRSIGVRRGTRSHTVALRQLVHQIEFLDGQLREIEDLMGTQLDRVPYAANLLTIPRLGRITLATLLGEFGDLRGYKVAAQLIAMAGLDLVESSSGIVQGHKHISRKGRRYARQILYMAALRAGTSVLADKRRQKVEVDKKPPKKAAVANMARLLRVMHALVRDNQKFDPSRLQGHQRRAAA